MKSPNTDRLSAAADLIRNLDNALLGMNTAANSAADDAAKARRNAKAAGEVARRYRGGSSTKSGSNNRKKRGVSNSAENTNTNNLLEKKRERRAAARMAAEARERREHPYTHSSPSRVHRLGSPSRGTTPRTMFNNDTMDDAEVNKGILDETVEAIQFRATELEESKEKKEILVEDDNKVDGSPSSQNAEEMVEEEENVQERYSSLSNATGSTDFEDAMDEQEDEVVEDGQSMESEEQPEQPDDEGIGAPPTNNEYYNQQTSYYSSPDKEQQKTNINQNKEGSQTAIEYSDFSKNQSDQYYKEKLDASTPNKKNKIMPISTTTMSTPTHKHSIPPTPPRSQPTSTTRIEASHAEDVLSLSLELEKVRSQLTSTTAQLASATSQVSNLQDINDDLTSQLSAASVQHNQIAILQQQLDTEQRKSKAAEEDAALALDLAKDANSCKEECEMWLSRSLEEIDLWKGRFLELEKHQKEQLCQEKGVEDEDHQNKKSVRFDIKDDCPPSPMVSVEDGGTFGLDEDVHDSAVKATPQPPPPPPPTPSEHLDILSPIHAKGLMFSPPANSSTIETPLSKEAAILAGRAYLYRASQSPSPYSKGSLSPHPRLQASDLLKKSAETRRLLRERLLTPGRHGPKLSRPPMPIINANRIAGSTTDDTFASRQGAACQAVGKTIRESGARLKLSGKWWSSSDMLLTNDDTVSNEEEEGTIEELESMVKDYCGGVEGEIVQQRTKIDELLAFCDHLEKEMIV